MLSRVARTFHRCLCIACVLALCAFAAPDPSPAGDGRVTFVFRVEGVSARSVLIQGDVMVDGKHVVIDRETTPYEFRCEAANSLVGSFQPIDVERWIRVKAFLPAYSKKKSVNKAKGSRIGLEWSGDGNQSRIMVWAEKAR